MRKTEQEIRNEALEEWTKVFIALTEKWKEAGFELNTLKDQIGTLEMKKEIEDALQELKNK